MKTFKTFLAAMAGFVLGGMVMTSCDKSEIEVGKEYHDQVVAMTGQVVDIDQYGMLIPSFTPSDLLNAGYDYADLLDVHIGDDIVLHDVPFVTGFNEVGVMETCFCDYNAGGYMYGFGQLNGNFSERIGGKVGDRIFITLSKKQGYKNEWDVMKSIYTHNPEEYDSDEMFANFREVTTTGMAKQVLYRSSNPLNPKDNKVRYAYVDELARKAGIQTEIDLADTYEKIDNFRKYEDFSSTYCPSLYDNEKTIALGLSADYLSASFMQRLGDGLRFMVNNEPPYLVHCNEGKDRCGFVSLLLESLAGASYDEVAEDYMQTFINFYKIDKDDSSYKLRQQKSVDRMVWMLANYKTMSDFAHINWDETTPETVDLQKAAHDYIIDCGLSESECAQLQARLQGK